MKKCFYDDFKTVLSRILIFSVLGLILISVLITSLQKNYFDFDHPEDAWITDCLIFFDKPDLVRKNNKNLADLFGYEGENGIASAFAAKHDKTVNVMYNYYNYAYIVYLIYGTDCLGETPDTYFKLIYADGDDFFYDGENGEIEIGTVETYGALEATLDMTKAPSERLSVTLTDETVYGAIVIPVKFRNQRLGASAFVDMSVSLERKNTAVDTGERFIFYYDAEVTHFVEVPDVSVGFLTEKDYNYGNYEESSITPAADFRSGEAQYVVVDFQIRSLTNNVGYEPLKIMTSLSDKNVMTMKIQEAPTGNFEEKTDGNRTKLLAIYTIPKNKGEEKTVRMILKLVSLAERDVEFDIFISVGNDTVIAGDLHKALVFHIGASD